MRSELPKWFVTPTCYMYVRVRLCVLVSYKSRIAVRCSYYYIRAPQIYEKPEINALRHEPFHQIRRVENICETAPFTRHWPNNYISSSVLLLHRSPAHIMGCAAENACSKKKIVIHKEYFRITHKGKRTAIDRNSFGSANTFWMKFVLFVLSMIDFIVNEF